jgi:phosphonate transport system permease protein
MKHPDKTKTTLVILAVAALYIWSSIGTGANPITLFLGGPDMANLLQRMWPPNLPYLLEMIEPLVETTQMAMLGTLVGAILAIPVIFLASKNISTVKPVYYATKAILNLIRTVPDLLLASIFAGALGYGALPGVMALGFFSFGIIAKLASETVEAIDPGPMEALTAVGSPKANVIFYSVVPQVLPQFIAYCLYVFEINIRAATVLGLVGAGGIGMWLMRDMNLMMYRNACAIIIMIFVFVLLIDTASNWLRGRLV